MHLESGPLKSYEKVQNLTPRNLNNLIIAAEGYQKPRDPPASKKSPKSDPKGSQMAPNGAIGAQNAPQGPSKNEQKTEEEKDTQKELKINLV